MSSCGYHPNTTTKHLATRALKIKRHGEPNTCVGHWVRKYTTLPGHPMVHISSSEAWTTSLEYTTLPQVGHFHSAQTSLVTDLLQAPLCVRSLNTVTMFRGLPGTLSMSSLRHSHPTAPCTSTLSRPRMVSTPSTATRRISPRGSPAMSRRICRHAEYPPTVLHPLS